MGAPFVHLHVHSPYSFLEAGSSLEELVRRAAALGMPALALTDTHSLAGAPAFVRLCAAAGLKPVLGAEVQVEEAGRIVLLCPDERGYRALSRLISAAYRRGGRQGPRASWSDLEAAAPHLLALTGGRRGAVARLYLAGGAREAAAFVDRLAALFPGRLYLELGAVWLPGDRALHRFLADLGGRLGLPLVAANDVRHAGPERFRVWDLLSCVAAGVRVEEAHPARPLNAESYLKDTRAMAEALREFPRALATAREVAERCGPALVLGRKRYPCYPLPPGLPAAALLRRLAEEGARRRYGRLDGAVRERLDQELAVIAELGFADYFLVACDLARFARRRGIRYAGRGSAADSLVAYCLGLTEVDALARGLLFERFLSLERGEPPDIDLDFDARRRDEVRDYAFRRYGADRVACVATFPSYGLRLATRELGKALGYAEEELARLARRIPYDARSLREALEAVPELREVARGPDARRRLAWLVEAVDAVQGFPRHVGTHLGGILVMAEPVEEVVPVQPSPRGLPLAQVDRDTAEELGLAKFDLLPLRMLSAVEESVQSLRAQGRRVDPDALPLDDAETYAMIRRGETVGVFQLESPAQRALQPRLGAERLEDLVAAVALIRPGPIQGDLVEPFLRRRRGEEPVDYPHPALEPILRKTYGVVVYQEQVIAIARAVAGFTPGEADQLRRTMSHARSREAMAGIGRRFVERAVARGLAPEAAEAVFRTLQGYASYGFCEAHAAAFGLTAYRSAYLARHHPAAFYAALLSCQPMGYYSPNTLLHEARRRGVEVLPLDVNRSEATWRVEGERAIRVGFSQVLGLRQEAVRAILAARAAGGPFRSLEAFCRRAAVGRDATARLILAGAFDALDPHRRRLLWRLEQAEAGREAPGMPLLPADEGELLAQEELRGLPDFSEAEKELWEWRLLGLMLRGHVMARFREGLRRRGFRTAAEARELADGTPCRVAGLLIRPHRPPTRSGRRIVFLSLEDETGLCDVTVFEAVYERHAGLLFGGRDGLLEVEGRVRRRDGAASLVAGRIASFRQRP